MWEYQTIYRGNHETNLSNMSEFLNLKGKQGWELVQVISKPFRDDPFEFANHTFIFKRESTILVLKHIPTNVHDD